MTELHMDVDSVRAVMELLVKEKENLQQLVKPLNDNIADLRVGRWKGYAASVFYNEYEEVRVDLMKRLENMEMLAGELGQAIADWEAAAARLGK